MCARAILYLRTEYEPTNRINEICADFTRTELALIHILSTSFQPDGDNLQGAVRDRIVRGFLVSSKFFTQQYYKYEFFVDENFIKTKI